MNLDMSLPTDNDLTHNNVVVHVSSDGCDYEGERHFSIWESVPRQLQIKQHVLPQKS